MELDAAQSSGSGNVLSSNHFQAGEVALPFTREQFLAVLADYNRGVWPGQFVARLAETRKRNPRK